MNHPFPVDGRLPYEWKSVGDYWPSRLMHIPSWTSVERDGANCYRGVCKPEYSILTYTWGRWKIKDAKGEPALPVLGTSWTIPAVKQEHFTVEAFKAVVQKMTAGNVQWAWVDIACINQENSVAQAEEVGRQASIFKNARNVYVWLSHLQTETLALAIQVIRDQGIELRRYVDKLATSMSPLPLVGSLLKHFNTLFDDPWFSSLWTLQEVVLRNDAVVLSAQGEPIWWEPGQYLYLTILINHCQNMFKDFGMLEEQLSEDKEIMNIVAAMKSRILQAGFYYLFTDNPNVQYGTARYRTTSRDVDRIYAIMQVYNLRVGKSIRPDENPSLDELIYEFALAINSTCLIMGQLFVHTEATSRGKSWLITEKSTVPDKLMDYKDSRQESTMRPNSSGGIILTGQCCRFDEMQKIRQEAEEDRIPEFELNIALDEETIQRMSPNLFHERMSAGLRSANGRIPGSLLLTTFKDPLWVLRLGDIRGHWDGQAFDRRYVGLLVVNSERDSQPEHPGMNCRRLGVCTWEPRDSYFQEKMNHLEWMLFEVGIQ